MSTVRFDRIVATDSDVEVDRDVAFDGAVYCIAVEVGRYVAVYGVVDLSRGVAGGGGLRTSVRWVQLVMVSRSSGNVISLGVVFVSWSALETMPASLTRAVLLKLIGA